MPGQSNAITLKRTFAHKYFSKKTSIYSRVSELPKHGTRTIVSFRRIHIRLCKCQPFASTKTGKSRLLSDSHTPRRKEQHISKQHPVFSTTPPPPPPGQQASTEYPKTTSQSASTFPLPKNTTLLKNHFPQLQTSEFV